MYLRVAVVLFAVACNPVHTSSSAESSLKAAAVPGEVGLPGWVDGATLVTPDKITYLYHYTNDDDAATDPAKNLQGHLDWAATKNSGNRAISGQNIAGAGIYGAADPYSSAQFGGNLMILPIKAGSEVTVSGGPNLKEMVKNTSVAAIAYGYPSFLATSSGKFSAAVVIRDGSIIDMANIVTIASARGCSDAKLSELPPVDDLIKALQDAAKTDFSCAARNISVLADVHPIDQAFVDGLTDGNYFDLLTGAYLNEILRAIGSTSKDIPRYWDFASMLKSVELKDYTPQRFLSDAVAMKLLDAGSTAASYEDIKAAITAKLKNEHPELFATMKAEVQFYADLNALLSTSGMTTWTVK